MIATVTQIKNIYWDLVNAYSAGTGQREIAGVRSAIAGQREETTLSCKSVPAMDVMRAEAEVSKRDQDLTVARTSLQLQELLIKNAITKSLDDPDSGSRSSHTHGPFGVGRNGGC